MYVSETFSEIRLRITYVFAMANILIFGREAPSRQINMVLERTNVFEIMSDVEFINTFRLTKNLARSLIVELKPHLPTARRKSALSAEMRVLVALRFFAQGSYQLSVGNDKNLNICQKSVSNCLHSVVNAIVINLAPTWIKFPSNNELTKSRIKFHQNHHLMGIIGCIDCTHVAIISPDQLSNEINPPNPNSCREEQFVNRKGFHSINTQLVCDGDGKIISVNSQYPGCTHDSFIWRHCGLRKHLEQLYNSGNTSVKLLGDSGYPLEPWLMTPLSENDVQPNTKHESYNRLHKRARSLIERVNGQLKSRFRCLLRHRTLHYHPTVAAKIIISCCVLHNMCKVAQIPDIQEHEEIVNDQLQNSSEDASDEVIMDKTNILREGKMQRNIIIEALRGPVTV